MCRRYVLASKLDTIENRFGFTASLPDGWDPPIVVAPGGRAPVITGYAPGTLILSEFGMTPHWARNKMNLINARAEGDKNPGNDPHFNGAKAIFLKPAFQKPLFTRRCIVVADAFVEWSTGSQPIPYLFYLNERRHPIGMAGLYDVWTNPASGELIHSFTVITVTANPLLRRLPVYRMPAILPYGRESRWLKPNLCLSDILAMLRQIPAGMMNAYPVNKEILHSGPFNRNILLPEGLPLSSAPVPASLPVRSYYEHKKRQG